MFISPLLVVGRKYVILDLANPDIIHTVILLKYNNNYSTHS